METRLQQRREREQPQPVAGPGNGGGLDSLREEAGRLLAAGDDLIRRTLSGNSEQFLPDHRQMGGQ